MNEAKFMFQIEGLDTNTALFTAIQTAGNCFGNTSTAELQLLAEEYYIHSSKKRLSPLCAKWVHDAVDLTAFINKVASALVTRYGDNWKRIFDAYFEADYNPIENYDMTETTTPEVITTTTINTATKITNEQEGKTYGFNSDTGVPESENKVTTSGDADENETTSVQSFEGSDTLTRHGNIGVTTSQQMLESELNLRKLDYWGQVFNDIDRLLCFMVWSC